MEGRPDSSRRRRWSYADLLTESERVARALLGRFAPGERLAVWAPNSPEWLLVEFGAALAGLTLVTVNPALDRHLRPGKTIAVIETRLARCSAQDAGQPWAGVVTHGA